MTPLDLETSPGLLLLVAALCGAGWCVQECRARVRDRRAARAALASVLAERGEGRGADDRVLQQESERDKDDRDGDHEDEDKLNVLKRGHAQSVPGGVLRIDAPDGVTRGEADSLVAAWMRARRG
jgi:hypothetical protein